MKPKMPKKKKNHAIDDDLEILPLTDAQLKSMRRITPEEHVMFCKALENTFHRPFPPRVGRPSKDPADKYKPLQLRIHPKALAWAKAEAKRRGIGYQTVINQTLLEKAA